MLMTNTTDSAASATRAGMIPAALWVRAPGTATAALPQGGGHQGVSQHSRASPLGPGLLGASTPGYWAEFISPPSSTSKGSRGASPSTLQTLCPESSSISCAHPRPRLDSVPHGDSRRAAGTLAPLPCPAGGKGITGPHAKKGDHTKAGTRRGWGHLRFCCHGP